MQKKIIFFPEREGLLFVSPTLVTESSEKLSRFGSVQALDSFFLHGSSLMNAFFSDGAIIVWGKKRRGSSAHVLPRIKDFHKQESSIFLLHF
jgi:hypothetical protein